MNTLIINSRISLNHLTVFVEDSFQKIVQQKKVLQIVSIAFGCLTLIYLTYRYCYFYSKQVTPYKKEDIVPSFTKSFNPDIKSFNPDILDLQSSIERSQAILKYLMKQPDSPEKESIKNAEKDAISKYQKLLAILDSQKAKTDEEKDCSSGPTSEKIEPSIPADHKMNMTSVLNALKKKKALKSPELTPTTSIPEVKSSLQPIPTAGKNLNNAIFNAIKKRPILKPVDAPKLTERKTQQHTDDSIVIFLQSSPLFQKIAQANGHGQDTEGTDDSDSATDWN